MIRVRDTQAGFSLVELLVAMLVTMVVSGAVFGLMAAGQGAFKREPQLTDRQQSIRIAMNMIQRDIETAGAGMDPFEQAFTRGDGVNEGGTLLNAVGPGVGPSLQPWDVLEVMGPDPNCTEVPVAAAPTQPTVTTMANLPNCFGANTMAALIMPAGSPDRALWGWASPNAATTVLFNNPQPAKSDIATKGWLTGAERVMPLQLSRYAIAIDPNDGVPGLWRSQTGGLDVAGNRVPPGGVAGGWQLIARGIEDMQVRYRHQGDPAFPGPLCCGSPQRVITGTWTTLVQEVEVTLWARTVTPAALQGQTNRGGVTAVHGMLQSVTAPRAALMAMRDAVPPLWQ